MTFCLDGFGIAALHIWYIYDYLLFVLVSQGALSLEDALSKGLPIQKDIVALHTHIEGIDNDSLIALVLSSLPEDTQRQGTDTPSELNHKASDFYLYGTCNPLSFPSLYQMLEGWGYSKSNDKKRSFAFHSVQSFSLRTLPNLFVNQLGFLFFFCTQ